jgi:hypothetical protein
MLFDEVTPNTSVYMIAGYAIFFLITTVYLVSLFVRSRNLRRDLESLQSMQQEPEPVSFAPVAVPARAKARPSRTSSSKAARSKPARKRASKKK